MPRMGGQSRERQVRVRISYNRAIGYKYAGLTNSLLITSTTTLEYARHGIIWIASTRHYQRNLREVTAGCVRSACTTGSPAMAADRVIMSPWFQ